MTMTDPIADMLTRLRNANQAYHDTVSMPYSKLKQGVAEILKQEGYITSFEVQDLEDVVGKTLEIQLKYGRNRERSIAGVRRISKPGLRVYAKSTNLPRVLGGLGVAILSTSSGLLTDRQASKKGVGGEVLEEDLLLPQVALDAAAVVEQPRLAGQAQAVEAREDEENERAEAR